MDSMTKRPQSNTCKSCLGGVDEPFPFTMAFQPIVNVETERIFAYEALVRGVEGQSAGSVLSQVTPENKYRFDQNCRMKAIQLARRLNLAESGAALSINFMPGAVYNPAACLQLTLRTAHEVGFPTDKLIFEIVESEEILDREHLLGITNEYRKHGFRMALDDFGAGYAELNVLGEIPLELVKLDRELISNIDQRPAALSIVRAMVALCGELGSQVIAEGVERVEEFEILRSCGVKLMQGYLFARPGFECLPEVYFPPTLASPTLEPLKIAV